MLLQPFFASGEGIFWTGNQPDQWIQLGINIAGLLAITLWSGAHCVVLFGGLKYFRLLRIDSETELRGCDIIKHGESAYPVEAWKEIQYDSSQKLPHPSIIMQQDEVSRIESLQPSSVVQNKHFKSGTDNLAMENIE